MIRLIGLLFGVLAAALLTALAIGFLLPSEWAAERTASIAAPPDEVYPHVASAEAWTEWTPSPESGVELFGPASGLGSGRRWDDPGYGSGEFVITEATEPHLVGYVVDVEGGAIRIAGRITLEATAEGTRVRWREEGDFGWNPLLGYLAGRMGDLQGEQLDASLRSLRAVVEEGRSGVSGERGSSEEAPRSSASSA